jgi:hypothetical protein
MATEPGTEIVSVRLGGNARLLVEAVSFDRRAGEAAERGLRPLDQDWDDVVRLLQQAGQALSESLQAIKPARATVEFGIQLAVESGKLTALLVKGTGSASLKVTLEWAGAA